MKEEVFFTTMELNNIVCDAHVKCSCICHLREGRGRWKIDGEHTREPHDVMY